MKTTLAYLIEQKAGAEKHLAWCDAESTTKRWGASEARKMEAQRDCEIIEELIAKETSSKVCFSFPKAKRRRSKTSLRRLFEPSGVPLKIVSIPIIEEPTSPNASNAIYEKLVKAVAYAKTTPCPQQSLHEVYGKITMAHELGALTLEEYLTLNTACVKDGINNPEYFTDEFVSVVERLYCNIIS